MKFTGVVGGLVVAIAHVHAGCSTSPWGSCLNSGKVSCCPDVFYCHPWTPSNFQCRQKPTKCQRQYTNVFFVGNDMNIIYDLQPDDCCTQCTKTKGCTAYTFVNYRPGKTACYLMRVPGEQKPLIGAVSGIVADHDVVSPSPNACKTKPYDGCGNQTASFCCPDGLYCQPWNSSFYQCVQTPSQCPFQLTDIEFPGNDIGRETANTGEECCATCKRSSKCKAYTFVNVNSSGPQCHLKSSAGDTKGVRKLGAVSGRR